MKVIIVSDDPESQLYHQIIKLKKDIEKIIYTPVDVISLSTKNIIVDINRNIKISKESNIKKQLEEIFQKIKYDFYIFSLNKNHITLLFKNKINILDQLDTNAEIFIFGAWSEIRSLKGKNIHIFRRPGVSKLTKQFKENILLKISNLQKTIDSCNNPGNQFRR